MRSCWPAAVLMPVTCFLAASSPSSNESIFREQILPVLQANCATCHAVANPASDFSIKTFDDILRGGKHGPAITPGKSDESLLVQYVRGEKTPKMPMGGALPDAAITSLAAAIDRMQPAQNQAAARDAYLDWVLHAPKPPAIPGVKRKEWVKNPVDAFILSKLEEKGLEPAPTANRRALLRRVYFDLIGLPPSPEEIEHFINDPSADAYEKVVDKLLADRRYGERWARHWLDLVRYAETDGFAIDSERPTAWRYRDYVIRAFNDDKPYNLFVKEQLAGDELTGKQFSAEKRSERLVALGFLRMGPWEADANFRTQLRQDFLNEVTSTTASMFLGLTVGCARCHNHKYDPIPQRDFYRMQAFFAATKIDERAAAFMEVEHPDELKRLRRKCEDEAEPASGSLKKLEERLKQNYIEAKHLKPDDKTAGDFQKALKDAKDPIYTAEERQAWQESKDLARKLNEAIPRYSPVAYSAADVTPPDVPAVADTYVLAGGELAAKGEKVEPGFLECITGTREPAKIPYSDDGSGRRLVLAEWIASPENPLASRVMVNRLWQYHFGDGIIRTPSDVGKNGDRPSNPELLDWLAVQFLEKKWSIKAVHKLMLTSNAYQQSAESPEAKRYAEIDPNNRLLWRMNWIRLEAEVVRDSILALSGRLQSCDGGPGVFLNIPADVAEGFEFFKWFPSDEQEQLRRTIYTFQRRSVVMPMMEVFDGANMSESCARRNITTVAPQAFSLLNSEFTNTEAKYFAGRVMKLAGNDAERQIDEAFRLALGRAPTVEETGKARALFVHSDARDALTRLAVVLFNLNEFIYLE
ncbi:MAG: hypothetical protein DMG57_00855 [Acidobacteria bacterium]|nr:MAG: hypothetical protein DMG57_00855 [Acidobacteriota bacterium]